MSIYVVKPGDTLSGIAKKQGLKAWQDLYYDPSNAAFRTKRPNPNLIFPGDQVVIPSKGQPGPARPHPHAVAAAIANAPFDYSRYGIFAKNVPAMRAELNKGEAPGGQKESDKEFLEFLEKTKTAWGNASWMTDRLENAVKVVRYYKVLKAIGLPMSEMKALIPVLVMGKEGEKLLMAIIEQEGKLTSVLKGASKTGAVVGIFLAGLQIYEFAKRSEYGAAAGEFYKNAMALGVPVGALIDGVEVIVTTLMVSSGSNPKKLNQFWKFLRGFNPIAMGGAAVDIFGTVIQMAISKDADDQKLDRLVERLKNSPAQVWLELGEKFK